MLDVSRGSVPSTPSMCGGLRKGSAPACALAPSLPPSLSPSLPPSSAPSHLLLVRQNPAGERDKDQDLDMSTSLSPHDPQGSSIEVAADVPTPQQTADAQPAQDTPDQGGQADAEDEMVEASRADGSEVLGSGSVRGRR